MKPLIERLQKYVDDFPVDKLAVEALAELKVHRRLARDIEAHCQTDPGDLSSAVRYADQGASLRARIGQAAKGFQPTGDADAPFVSQSGELGYATRLAVYLWETYWKAASPDWKPLPDLMGVLTQIDNMVANLAKPNESISKLNHHRAKKIDLLRELLARWHNVASNGRYGERTKTPLRKHPLVAETLSTLTNASASALPDDR